MNQDKMRCKHLYYNYDWSSFPDALMPRIIREFHDNGANHFVFTTSLLQRALNEPDFIGFLKNLEHEYGIKFGAMHALFSENEKTGLSLPDPELRPAMLETYIKSLQIASEFEMNTVTVHSDAYFYVHNHTPLEKTRPFFQESLEILLPQAEKYGVIIAIENCFEKPNSAKEIVNFAAPYAGNPHLGFCYDTGHANIMSMAPWKDKAMYGKVYPIPGFWTLEREWWEGIEFENDAFEKMKDNIVTCHIHDNNGYNDLHGMPYDGTIDWTTLLPNLRACPRMVEYQTEICYAHGFNWAGPLLAPKGGYSIKQVVETFQKMFPKQDCKRLYK